MKSEIANELFENALRSFIIDYEKGCYNPRTEADVQFYLMACCKELLQEQDLELDIHANDRLLHYPAWRGKKLDIVIAGTIVVEIKFEADYPGVSKPVVFPREAAKDIERLIALREAGISYCHFIFLDEDGTHFRNFDKYSPVPLTWQTVCRKDRGPSKLLHLVW